MEDSQQTQQQPRQAMMDGFCHQVQKRWYQRQDGHLPGNDVLVAYSAGALGKGKE